MIFSVEKSSLVYFVFFDTIVLCTITPAWKYAMQFCEVENDEE